MSAYVTLSVPMTDQDCLLAALADVGFGPGVVEVHEVAVPLIGYEGDRRVQHAHVVVRARHVGSSSNDLGFERTDTGFRLHVSDYDGRRFGETWRRELRTRYNVHHAVKLERLAAEERRREEERREAERRALVEAQRLSVLEKAKKLGYRVEESREGATVRLVLRRRVYG